MPAEALGPNRHTLSSYPAHMSRVSLERSRGAVLERMGMQHELLAAADVRAHLVTQGQGKGQA